MLRTSNEGAIRFSLRELHVRWGHASPHATKRMLERVGVADEVLKMIQEVTDTCKVCRQWANPCPSRASNIEAAVNVQVECDLIFIHKHIIFHMIDRCTRWHTAAIIENKEKTPFWR